MKSKTEITPVFIETEEEKGELKLFFNLPEKANKDQLQVFKKRVKNRYLNNGIPSYYLSSNYSLSKKYLVLIFTLSK